MNAGMLISFNLPLWCSQVACWTSHIGVASCLKWAPRRAMFVAAASNVVTFWIPNTSNAAPSPVDTEAGAQSEHPLNP